MVIHGLYFAGGLSSYVHRYNEESPSSEGPDSMEVREIPESMLALVATGVRVYISLHIMLTWLLSYTPPSMSGTRVYMLPQTSPVTCLWMYTMDTSCPWSASNMSVLVLSI